MPIEISIQEDRDISGGFKSISTGTIEYCKSAGGKSKLSYFHDWKMAYWGKGAYKWFTQ